VSSVSDLFGYDPPPTRPFRPSNGTGGELFCEQFCYRCKRDVDENCEILGRTLIYHIDDPEYPIEWVQDDVPYPQHAYPRCTAFEPL
jgi:hypothetical protein